MDKISGKMGQDGAKMQQMKDVSSVLGPLRGEGYHQPANSLTGRGGGEGPLRPGQLKDGRVPGRRHTPWSEKKDAAELASENTLER